MRSLFSLPRSGLSRGHRGPGGIFLLCWLACALPLAGLAYDFGAWPKGTSPQEIGDRVADNYIKRRFWNFNHAPEPQWITYPESCTWYGALEFATLTNNAALTKNLDARYERIRTRKLVFLPQSVDFDSFGAVAFELWIRTKRADCLEVGRTLADAQWQPPDEPKLGQMSPERQKRVRSMVEQDLFPYTSFRLDDMYMLTILQVQAYRATGEWKYIDRAAREMLLYVNRLQQPSGLFHHSPGAPVFWGRGNGWMAAGMTELLRSLPQDHPARPQILASYQKMAAALLRYQDTAGTWRQLIDDPESWPETSCSGMFAFSFITGVQEGWLDSATYGPAARRAWLALLPYIQADGDIREVCEGTNMVNDRQYYLKRKRFTGDLHGQAPLLWCANAFLRKK